MNKMFPFRKVAFSVLLTLGCLVLRAQSSSTLQFIENKGQWDKSVLFSADMQASGFYLNAGGYTVLNRQVQDKTGKPLNTPLYSHSTGKIKAVNGTAGGGNKGEPSDAGIVKTYVYGVRFLGTNPQVQIIPDKPTGGYNNYFLGNDRSTWASHCRTFLGVVYKDMYPGIDVRYYSEAGLLKYNLIVHPGADLSAGATPVQCRHKTLCQRQPTPCKHAPRRNGGAGARVLPAQ